MRKLVVGHRRIWGLEIQHLGREVEISRTARKLERDVGVWNVGVGGPLAAEGPGRM